MNPEVKETVKKVIKALGNLNEALAAAHGGPYSLEYLESISALELLMILAVNDITLVGPPKETPTV